MHGRSGAAERTCLDRTRALVPVFCRPCSLLGGARSRWACKTRHHSVVIARTQVLIVLMSLAAPDYS
eukprot:2467284-Prymnesium_polylepis.1